MPEVKDDVVDVEQDTSFVDKWLRRQKYAWMAVGLLLVVTFTGLLGRGPLAKKTVSAGPGQLEVTYERVLHYKTPAVIEVHLPQYALQSARVRVLLEGAVAHSAAFQQVIPQPFSADPLPDGIVAEVPITSASQDGRMMIFQQPSAVGPITSRIGLEGGPSLKIEQFILP